MNICDTVSSLARRGESFLVELVNQAGLIIAGWTCPDDQSVDRFSDTPEPAGRDIAHILLSEDAPTPNAGTVTLQLATNSDGNRRGRRMA
jgi:hypothetical protein